VRLDKIVLNHMIVDPEGLNRDLKNGGCEASAEANRFDHVGSQSTGANREGAQISQLRRCDRDRSRVVGYGLSLYKAAGERQMKDEKKVGVDLG